MKTILKLSLLILLFASPSIPVHAQGNGSQPIVHAVMFWMAGCPHCEDVIENVLPPLREKYGDQFDLLMIEVASTNDVNKLLAVAESYGIPKDQAGVPFLIIGENVLMGSDQVREQLPTLIDDYLAAGGVEWTANPLLSDDLPDSQDIAPVVSNSPVEDEEGPKNNGFILAIAIMIGMAIALIYSTVAFVQGRALSLPTWTNWLIPILITIGIGVATYLSYIETQSVKAICGPVGDCNAVQQSRYAKLFGVLPIGIMGLLGYLALLAAWLANQFITSLEKPAAISFFSMAFFAVIFSLYLTYLEPFVIKAVCIWCLSSAVIVTLLLFLGTPSAIQQFTASDNE